MKWRMAMGLAWGATSLLQTGWAQSAPVSAALQQIKTVFVIGMENHNLIGPAGSDPQQLFGNNAAPYFNRLITPGNSNAALVSYATRCFNVGKGVHPSEPNYVWAEAATDFGFHGDDDPSTNAGNIYTAPHLAAQLNAAGIPWKNYEEDVSRSPGPGVSLGGFSPDATNLFYGTGDFGYAAKHNPMVFFSDTANQNVFELAALLADLTNNATGRYNWIAPNLYNDSHTPLPNGFIYNQTAFTGDQAAIAQGDNFLAMIVPRIMASAAFTNNGVIVIRWDETEDGDTTNCMLPEIIISPLAKGNAYASPVECNHSSDLRTWEEVFDLGFVSNSIPAQDMDVEGTGYNYVAEVNDLADMFKDVSIDPPAPPDSTGFHLIFSGFAGKPYTVLASDTIDLPLSRWTVVGGGTFDSGKAGFTDTNAAGHGIRFYIVKTDLSE